MQGLEHLPSFGTVTLGMGGLRFGKCSKPTWALPIALELKIQVQSCQTDQKSKTYRCPISKIHKNQEKSEKSRTTSGKNTRHLCCPRVAPASCFLCYIVITSLLCHRKSVKILKNQSLTFLGNV